MFTVTGTVTHTEIKRYRSLKRYRWIDKPTEIYDTRLSVCLTLDDGTRFVFRSPAVEWRIVTTPDGAFSYSEENDWIKTVPTNAERWDGVFPAPKIEVGQRITVKHRINERGFVTYAKLVEIAK